ncbi:aquaporin [Micromonospora sp. ALFpr18c]|uniref:MIP/aquaporin family protein n=1 Tax=unclassified Micromonospora TaxID=2617518 RepID=UPI00124B7001|nr:MULTISPECIES: aquaporin [unclassified Micromonospora]KAB1949715.1 aquaporin [Micromonospora sp. ALFpr18c]MDG4759815.1 aquaporin [Micromonospora sp. WMMD710]
MEDSRRAAAEFLGTLLLVFFGVGSAVAARVQGGVVVVALAFGFVMLALVYTIGPLSGSHVNPAVTLGVLLSGKITVIGAVAYWIAQFAGATVAGFALWALTRWGEVADQTGALGANGYGAHINRGGAAVLELILTFLFVLVVLVVTSRSEDPGVAGVAIGLALAATQLVGVTLTGAAVNPARAFGPAVFEGGVALRQLWLFIVFPLLGGAIAALVAPLIMGAQRHYWGGHDRSVGRPT